MAIEPRHRLHLARILIVLLLLGTSGCFYPRSDAESLQKFASAYVAFRKAAFDSEVMSWVIALDQSERTDGSHGTSYRRNFVGALDSSTSSRDRADFARQAIEDYDTKSKEMLGGFDNRNQALDDTSLALVEAAHAIGNDDYRRQAIAIADSARSIEHTLDTLRKNYVDTYDMQVTLLSAIAKDHGDLNRVLNVLQKTASDKQRLNSESDKLRTDEQASSEKLQEQYAAFKGMTGIKLDYQQPPNAAQSPHQGQ
jgi:hypothetical protein